jgi:hypothetical protein
MANYDTQTPAGDGDEKLPITEEVKEAFAEAMDLRRASALGIRIYNSTTETFYIMTLVGEVGAERTAWIPEA